jgi:hypothetical protein
MKPIGTFILGGGVAIDIAAGKGRVELHVKMMGASIFKKAVHELKICELSLLLEQAINEARKP